LDVSHIHGDSVTVYPAGPINVNGVNVHEPTWAERTHVDSGTGGYTWLVHDSQGNFNPNWTVTVNFTVDITAPTPNFSENATMAVLTPQVDITLNTNLFGGVDQGLLVETPGGSVLHSDPGFAAGSYTGHWTFPAVEVQTLAFGSTFLTGPSGSFTHGITAAAPGFTWSFSMTLNT
jgi:hypothetical protein